MSLLPACIPLNYVPDLTKCYPSYCLPPQYRSIIGRLGMEWHEKLRIKELQTAILKKLGYGFTWSELQIQPSDPMVNLVGAGLIPDVNMAANLFNSVYTTPGRRLQYVEKHFQVCRLLALIT